MHLKNTIACTKRHFILDEKVIPYFRIQNIDIDVGPIMRRYRLATLTLLQRVVKLKLN